MKLGNVIRKWRTSSDLTTAQVASEIGISISTLNRVEHCEPMDGKTLATILRWLISN